MIVSLLSFALAGSVMFVTDDDGPSPKERRTIENLLDNDITEIDVYPELRLMLAEQRHLCRATVPDELWPILHEETTHVAVRGGNDLVMWRIDREHQYLARFGPSPEPAIEEAAPVVLLPWPDAKKATMDEVAKRVGPNLTVSDLELSHDTLEQLMARPRECQNELPPDAVETLEASGHAAVYLAVKPPGSETLIWRWAGEGAELVSVP